MLPTKLPTRTTPGPARVPDKQNLPPSFQRQTPGSRTPHRCPPAIEPGFCSRMAGPTAKAEGGRADEIKPAGKKNDRARACSALGIQRGLDRGRGGVRAETVGHQTHANGPQGQLVVYVWVCVEVWSGTMTDLRDPRPPVCVVGFLLWMTGVRGAGVSGWAGSAGWCRFPGRGELAPCPPPPASPGLWGPPQPARRLTPGVRPDSIDSTRCARGLGVGILIPYLVLPRCPSYPSRQPYSFPHLGSFPAANSLVQHLRVSNQCQVGQPGTEAGDSENRGLSLQRSFVGAGTESRLLDPDPGPLRTRRIVACLCPSLVAPPASPSPCRPSRPPAHEIDP